MTMHRRAFLAASTTSLAAPLIVSATGARAGSSDAKAALKNPTFVRRKVGAFKVTVLLDGTLPIEPGIVTGWDADKAAASYKSQHLSVPTGGMPIPVLGYIVDTGAKVIAVDTGTVPGFAPSLSGYHAALAEAGYKPSDIDTVLLTHLHPDHIGGLTDNGASVFNDAQVYVGASELDFWQNTPAPEGFEPFFAMANAWIPAYDGRIKTLAGDDEVTHGVSAVDLPGHTPGHMGFRFHSEGEDLLIWGDVIHLTKLQFANPDWTIAFDMIPDLTLKTRAKMLDMAATDGMLVAGAHLDFPGAGYVEKAGSAYRFSTAPYDYSV